MKKIIFLSVAAITFIAVSPNVTFAKVDAVRAEVSKTFVVASVNVIAPTSNDVFITYYTLESLPLTLAAVKSHECRYIPIRSFRRSVLSYSLLLHPTATSVSHRIKQFYSPPLMRC